MKIASTYMYLATEGWWFGCTLCKHIGKYYDTVDQVEAARVKHIIQGSHQTRVKNQESYT